MLQKIISLKQTNFVGVWTSTVSHSPTSIVFHLASILGYYSHQVRQKLTNCLLKLERYGIRAPCHKWFVSSLSNRLQNTGSGVPQRSCGTIAIRAISQWTSECMHWNRYFPVCRWYKYHSNQLNDQQPKQRLGQAEYMALFKQTDFESWQDCMPKLLEQKCFYFNGLPK